MLESVQSRKVKIDGLTKFLRFLSESLRFCCAKSSFEGSAAFLLIRRFFGELMSRFSSSDRDLFEETLDDPEGDEAEEGTDEGGVLASSFAGKEETDATGRETYFTGGSEADFFWLGADNNEFDGGRGAAFLDRGGETEAFATAGEMGDFSGAVELVISAIAEDLGDNVIAGDTVVSVGADDWDGFSADWGTAGFATAKESDDFDGGAGDTVAFEPTPEELVDFTGGGEVEFFEREEDEEDEEADLAGEYIFLILEEDLRLEEIEGAK